MPVSFIRIISFLQKGVLAWHRYLHGCFNCSVMLSISDVTECGSPQSPMNSRVVDYSPENTVTYQCIEGYVPPIVRVSVCTHRGQWTPDPLELICTLRQGM